LIGNPSIGRDASCCLRARFRQNQAPLDGDGIENARRG
jgi:hypothetical protein